MVSHVTEFEYITCNTEVEALILECNLIKKYEPKYNILLRDDKTYPYIKLTLGEKYPRILKTRRLVSDGSRYFGPYADAGAVNTIIDLLNSAYALKRCGATEFAEDSKPCLNYHIHQCKGICMGGVSPEEYAAKFARAHETLRNRTPEQKAEAARKANETHSIYAEDIEILKGGLSEICRMLNQFLSELPSTKR